MKKNEFLADLRRRLDGLSDAEIRRSLDFYSEMIDERMDDGLSEDVAVSRIGTPAEVAEIILTDVPLSTLVYARVRSTRSVSPWLVILLILGSPIWLSLAVAAAAVVISLLAALWSVVISLFAATFAVGITGVALIPGSLVPVFLGNFYLVFLYLGAGLLLSGLSVFMFLGCVQLARGACAVCVGVLKLIKRCFIRKEAIS